MKTPREQLVDITRGAQPLPEGLRIRTSLEIQAQLINQGLPPYLAHTVADALHTAVLRDIHRPGGLQGKPPHGVAIEYHGGVYGALATDAVLPLGSVTGG